jgi:large subunit ribosomal protein L10
MLNELEDRFRNVKQTGCVLVSYQGMKADAARSLRQQARQKGAEVTVVRNALFGLAMERLGAGEVKRLLAGPVAVVSSNDPVAAAKAAAEIAKAAPAVKVRGAYFEGNVVGPEGVEKLAKIPGREVLLSMVAGAFMAPLRRLAFGLLAKPRELMSVLEQLKKRTAEAEGTEQASQSTPAVPGVEQGE